MNPESTEDGPARATTAHVDMHRGVGKEEHDTSSRTDSSTDVKHDGDADMEADGGLAAWMTVAGAWLIFFVSLGLVNTFGSFQDHYARVYLSDSSISAIGWISSVQLGLMYLVGPFVGVLFDRGYFLSITLFGATLYSLSMFMLSLAQPQAYYQIFLTHGVGTGLGIGFLLLPAVSLIGQHFNRRRPLASGIAFTGASVGGIVLPQIFNHLVPDQEGSLGWGNGMRVMAAVLTVFIFGGLALMKRKTGVTAPSAKRADAEVARKELQNEKVRHQLVRYAKEAEYVWVLLGLFILSLCALYPLFYLQLFAALRGIPQNVTLNVVTILNASAIPGRIVPNYLSQHFGIVNLLIVSSLACMAIIIGMLGVGVGDGAAGGIIGVAVFYGFFSGGILSQMTPALASTARNINEIGARTGVGFIGIGIASLLGPPIMGWLLTNSYIWWRVTVFSGAGMGVTAICFAFAHVLKARRVGSRFV